MMCPSTRRFSVYDWGAMAYVQGFLPKGHRATPYIVVSNPRSPDLFLAAFSYLQKGKRQNNYEYKPISDIFSRLYSGLSCVLLDRHRHGHPFGLDDVGYAWNYALLNELQDIIVFIKKT